MKKPEWHRDLVLVGGGHAHALVLRMLAMRPLEGVRTSLVSLDDHTPYSGMLPGLVAGHCSFDQVHIDLRRYCARLGVRFITARADGLNTSRQELELEGRPALPFDVLSLDIGSQPGLNSVPGAEQFAVPVKPLPGFFERWSAIEAILDVDARIVLVGGGAGSVELALAMSHKLAGRHTAITLVCGGALLEGYAASTRKKILKRCRECSVEVLQQSPVIEVEQKDFILASGQRLPFDHLFWCTSAVAEGWPGRSGLRCDERGFVLVRDSLQLLEHDNIFAAGDIATQVLQPRPKAGVFAVRQAPYLAHNLNAYLMNQTLRPYTPQENFLSLLSLGNRSAIAERGLFRAQGAWVWHLKNAIDSRFMKRFEGLPAEMPQPKMRDRPQMHCGGCGAKIPGAMLRRVLSELAERYPSVIDSDQLADDAAALKLPVEQTLWQSVDVLREFVDDPWLMGRISILHALSDLHAMGAQAHSVLAHITLAYGSAAIQSRELGQIMAGALHELAKEGARLIGGHTLEGPELSVGFTVNGTSNGCRLGKDSIAEGDHLVLCKALGTGVLLAAQQQGLAAGSWVRGALNSMLQSNRAASDIAQFHGLCAATDITGFGLLGHLSEMLVGRELQICLQLERIPVLTGVRECYARHIQSTLQSANIDNVHHCLLPGLDVCSEKMQPLFDPQTSGGLLLAAAPDKSAALLESLKAADYSHAAIIGQVQSRPEGGAAIFIDV